MTERRPWLGPLGRRLMLAFALVAVASVAVVTVAALIGSARGVDASQGGQRQAAADSAARDAAQAYVAAGGWPGADLSAVATVADSVDANWVVRDLAGNVVAGSAAGPGGGMMMMSGQGRGGVSADVLADGTLVGSVRLAFGTAAAAQGRTIAWAWILTAAVLSLLLAFVVAILTSRWLEAPILRLAATARAFAGGERSARPDGRDLAADTELGDLARAFDAAAADVERSEGVRRRLASDVAHELRTPLAALQAGLEEMEDGLAPATPERIAALHQQSLRLSRIVEDLAVLSAAESAAFTLRREDVVLADVLDDAVLAARPALVAAGIDLHVIAGAEDAHVLGDADRLHQVFGNLLGNAARYCRAGDSVTVSWTVEADAVVVTVSDTGPGIGADELPHVFDRMWRGSTQGATAGSGIGLAVVREIVEAHGGTVAAISDGATGSRFVVRLPASAGR